MTSPFVIEASFKSYFTWYEGFVNLLAWQNNQQYWTIASFWNWTTIIYFLLQAMTTGFISRTRNLMHNQCNTLQLVIRIAMCLWYAQWTMHNYAWLRHMHAVTWCPSRTTVRACKLTFWKMLSLAFTPWILQCTQIVLIYRLILAHPCMTYDVTCCVHFHSVQWWPKGRQHYHFSSQCGNHDIVIRILACLPTGLIRYLGVVFVPYQEYNFYFSTVSGDASWTKKMWDLSRAMTVSAVIHHRLWWLT